MPASLELVKIALQAYGGGDVEIALAALCDPLIRWDERASRPDGDLVWGHDDVAKAMRRYLDGWEQYRFELEDIAEVAPGKVVGICRERGVDSEGVPVDRRFGGLWVVEGAKIASWSTYLTPKEAVRAARELVAEQPREQRQAPRRPKPGRARSPRRSQPCRRPRPQTAPTGARPKSSAAPRRRAPSSSASAPRANSGALPRAGIVGQQLADREPRSARVRKHRGLERRTRKLGRGLDDVASQVLRG